MGTEFLLFAGGAALNLAVAAVIVRGIYYPQTRDKRYVLTFLAFNTVIYFVMALLRSTELGVEVGFGLFAIFSLLRYRTDPLPIREMTYLFVIIALPVANAMLNTAGQFWYLALADGVVMLVMYALEREWGFQYENRIRISYDRVELASATQREALLADLRERTGLPIKRVTIGKLDLIRDTVEISAYYDARPQAADEAEGVSSQGARPQVRAPTIQTRVAPAGETSAGPRGILE